MDPALQWILRVLPEEQFEFRRRCRILYELQCPVETGRRALAARTSYSEAVLRRECRILQEQKLIRLTSCGAALTSQGGKWIAASKVWIPELIEDFQLEENLSRLLSCGWRVRLAEDDQTLFQMAAWDKNPYTQLKDAEEALEQDPPDGAALRMLRQKGVSLGWQGRYFDDEGRVLYRRQQGVSSAAAVIATCRNSRTKALSGALEEIWRVLGQSDKRLLYMRRDFAQCLWMNFQKRG